MKIFYNNIYIIIINNKTIKKKLKINGNIKNQLRRC